MTHKYSINKRYRIQEKPNAFWLVGGLQERQTLLLDLQHIDYSCEIFFCLISLSIPQCIAIKSNATLYISSRHYNPLLIFVLKISSACRNDLMESKLLPSVPAIRLADIFCFDF